MREAQVAATSTKSGLPRVGDNRICLLCDSCLGPHPHWRSGDAWAFSFAAWVGESTAVRLSQRRFTGSPHSTFSGFWGCWTSKLTGASHSNGRNCPTPLQLLEALCCLIKGTDIKIPRTQRVKA